MRYAPTIIALTLVVAGTLTVVPADVSGVGANVDGFPSLDATIADNRITPGEDTTLEVTIINEGRVKDADFPRNSRLASRVTTARGLKVEMLDKGVPFKVETGPQAVGNLPEGKSQPLAFDIAVKDDARPRSYPYEVPIKVSYTYTNLVRNNGEEEQKSVTRTVEVPIMVDNAARLDVVDVSSQARVGSTGTVAVTVENTGSMTARDASLRVESNNGAISFSGSSTASRHLGGLNDGEQQTVKYEATVSSSAKEQSYTVDAVLNYEDNDGVKQTSETRSFAITPQSQQIFAVESTDSTVAVGDSGTLTVTMRNQGPIPVSDATVKLASGSQDITFAQSSSATRFVGAWEPNETRTLEYEVTAAEDADTRSYSLDATVTYLDGEGDTETAPTRSLGVTPEPEQSFSIGDVSSNLAVGEEGTLRGTVTNTGEADVTNAVVVFESQKPNVTPLETEAPVGSLGAGESAQFSFPIEISESAEAGPKQYTMSVQYRNQEDERRTSDTIDVRQEVGPDAPEFSLETSGATVEPGQGTNLNVTVTNSGNQTYTDISANMFADSPMSVSDDEAFIGELGPGETETITFSVGASGGALEKTYPVSVDFQYDESDGDTKLSDTYQIPVSVERVETQQGGGPPLVILLGAGLAVSLAGAYLYRRSRG